MFDKDFFQRLSFQQICEFICTGDFLYPENVDEGTLTQLGSGMNGSRGKRSAPRWSGCMTPADGGWGRTRRRNS